MTSEAKYLDVSAENLNVTIYMKTESGIMQAYVIAFTYSASYCG